MPWATVTKIEVTDEVCGWSGAEHTPVAWYVYVTLDTGETRKTTTNSIIRRAFANDDLYMELVDKAWTSLTPKQKELVVNAS